jgi:5-methylcytosine-specific restriction endonuclease McrA
MAPEAHPPIVLEEEEVSTAVRLAMHRAFPFLHCDALDVEVLREAITAELLESLPGPGAMRNRFEDLLLGHEGVGVEQEEFERFYELLADQVERLTAVDDDEEDLAPGLCAMCERPMPLTFHHLIPKSTHADMLKRGLCAKEDLTRGVRICRPCHSAVHSFHDNKTLAVKYNTLDALLELEEIRKFIKWISKRAVRTRRPNW